MKAILLTFLAFSVYSKECDRFDCEDTAHPVPSGACGILGEEDSHFTWFLKHTGCNQKSHCIYSTTSSSLLVCEEKSARSLYPGEKCSEGVCEYASKKCNSKTKVCEGYAEGDSCVWTPDCNPGLRCSSNKCVPLLKVGEEGCNSDFDCVNSAGCHLKSGDLSSSYCVEYFSVKAGETIDVENCKSDTSPLCENMYCKRKDEVDAVCSEPVMSKHQNPHICNDDIDCTNIEYADYYNRCTCGLNSGGTSFCEPFFGDKQGTDYLTDVKAWLLSTDNQKHCNSLIRLSFECAKDWLKKDEYDNFLYHYLRFSWYPQLVEINDCARVNLFPDYKI